MLIPKLYSLMAMSPLPVFSLTKEISGFNKLVALRLASKCSPIGFFQIKFKVGTAFSTIFPREPAPKADILSEK